MNRGFSEETATIMTSSLSASTIRQYTTWLKLWWIFCNSREVDPFVVCVQPLVQFLQLRYDEGASYSYLNTGQSQYCLRMVLSQNFLVSSRESINYAHQSLVMIHHGTLTRYWSNLRHLTLCRSCPRWKLLALWPWSQLIGCKRSPRFYYRTSKWLLRGLKFSSEHQLKHRVQKDFSLSCTFPSARTIQYYVQDQPSSIMCGSQNPWGILKLNCSFLTRSHSQQWQPRRLAGTI